MANSDKGNAYKNGSISGLHGQASWKSPANIALVKYWGKLQGQIPMNPSISFVLMNSVIRISIDYAFTDRNLSGLQTFTVNAAENKGFHERIASYLHSVTPQFPFLREATLSIHSETSFPHSAGIASSAAAFSALALCLCEIENRLSGQAVRDGFMREASRMARLGSGSACRSVYNGFSVWGKTALLDDSSDEYATRISDDQVKPVFYTLRDAILIVDDSIKKVSSSAGHALMQGHAYRENRISQAASNLADMLKALDTADETLFFRVMENEALSLHSLMMSSNPGYLLLKPNTILLLDKIREFREHHRVNLGFTMDAGPNVHLIYFDRDRRLVNEWITEELAPLCKNGRWIDDAMGEGPVSSGKW